MTEEQSLQDLIIEEVTSNRLELPVFHPVALKLQYIAGDENISVADIEAILMEDQALASQILRMANSAFFKGLHTITTIRKAIIRLGLQQVANLAMAASQRSAYSTDNTLLHHYLEKLWQHAFASAMGSKWVAERCGYPQEADNAFLAGLLHNIGKLAIVKILEELCAQKKVTALSDTVIFEVLESPLHTEQGYRLMTQWNLPQPYCVIARDHHNAHWDSNNSLLVIVRLVDQACRKIGLGINPDPTIIPAMTPEAHSLGLTEIRLAELEIALEDTCHLQELAC
jgi:HD-like signal output (HDOD) protein